MNFKLPQIVNQPFPLDLFSISNYTLEIKREDQLHSDISGNKYRKLKYNILEANSLLKKTLLTFGGAYSNHIVATAAVGKIYGFKTIGVICGEELINKIEGNPSLSYAKKNGMKFHFITREEYKHKSLPYFIENLKNQYGDFYVLPEGGINELAVKGCEEILDKSDSIFDYVCAAVGTGGTLSGLIRSSYSHQSILGFSALKGNFKTSNIEEFTSKSNYTILDDYCFGGYAKIDRELIRFINTVSEITGIPLDPVYTGKMLYGIIDLIKKGFFKENSRILAIHTGGLQGIYGMNQKLIKMNLPQIKI